MDQSAYEIDLIIDSSPVEEDPDDQMPEESVQVITKPGDVWCAWGTTVSIVAMHEALLLTALMENRRRL